MYRSGYSFGDLSTDQVIWNRLWNDHNLGIHHAPLRPQEASCATNSPTICKTICSGALLAALLLAACGTGHAASLPSYLAPISGPTASTPAETATNNVLALDTAMFELYDNSGHIFQSNILARHPVIFGLFSGAGGRFILYRPGMAPLEAPPVPVVYQLLKSIGHSTLALSEIVTPYLDNPTNQAWRAPLLAYRTQMLSALDGLDETDMPKEWLATNRTILQNNIAFMDACASRGVISVADVQVFAKQQAPFLKEDIAWAAETQVAHWMGVIAEWKKMLGSAWNNTYAASNTIYVARQNNVLFSVLAQFFGPDAINSRLMLIETISFTTTPNEMLDALTRVIADRSVGALFFGNYYLMDYELMGGDARDAIADEDKKLGITPFRPQRCRSGRINGRPW